MDKNIINKEWLNKLVVIVDKLNEAIEIEDLAVNTHGWLSHLNGYVHSLDEYLNNNE